MKGYLGLACMFVGGFAFLDNEVAVHFVTEHWRALLALAVFYGGSVLVHQHSRSLPASAGRSFLYRIVATGGALFLAALAWLSSLRCRCLTSSTIAGALARRCIFSETKAYGC